jgi:hypothetical protein
MSDSRSKAFLVALFGRTEIKFAEPVEGFPLAQFEKVSKFTAFWGNSSPPWQSSRRPVSFCAQAGTLHLTVSDEAK